MPAYIDKRDGRTWRYRKRLTLPDGRRVRIEGTPPTNTRKAAEHAEAMHVMRVMSPGAVAPSADERRSARREERIPTFAEFADTFLDNYKPNQKPGPRRQKRHIVKNQLVPFFGGMRLDEIRQTDVDSFANEQLARVSAKTVNNRLAVLSTMLTYAADNVDGVERRDLRCHMRAVKPEVHAVPADDVRRLLDAATDYRYRLAILLASEAGLRVGEIRGLQWGDVDSDAVTVRRSIDPRGSVVAPKHDKRRRVPLSPALREALDAAPRRGLWVVPNESGDFIGYWTLLGKKPRVRRGRERPAEGLHAVYAAAGIASPDMPFHCLRHTFGTELAARVPLPVVRELMGHSEISTTMRYVTVVDAQKRDAISIAFGRQAGDKSTRRA